MKTISIILFIHIIFSIFLGLASCKKYPEGPNFSLKTKKSRVANTWVIEQYIYPDGSIDIVSNSPTYEFTKDGGYKLTFNSGSTYEGKWEFASNKEDINVIVSGASPETFKILKLKENEFWLENESEVVRHYIPK